MIRAPVREPNPRVQARRSVVAKCLRLFEASDRAPLVRVFLMMMLAAALEMLGIGLIFPVLKVASDPDGVRDYVVYSALTDLLGPLGQTDLLLLSLGTMFLFYLFKSSFLVVQKTLFSRFIFGRQVTLSSTLFTRYIAMPYRFHLQQNSSSILRTVNEEVTQVFQFVLVPVATLIIEVSLVSLVMIVLFAIEPFGSLVVGLAIGGTGYLFLRFLRRRTHVLGHLRYKHSREMIKVVQEAIHGIKEARVLDRETYFLEAYERACADFAVAARRQYVYGAAALPFIELMGIGAIVLMTYSMVRSGGDIGIVLPTLGVFGVAAARLMPSVNRMMLATTSIRGYDHLLSNLVNEIDKYEMAATNKDCLPAAEDVRAKWNKLEVESVSFAYEESAPVLQSFSLTLCRGELIGFVGASGSGKTTLVHILLGLIGPSAGRILLDEVPIDLEQPAWRTQFGFVSQDTYLCDDTVRRNVAFGLPDELISDERVWEALRLARLESHVRGLADGLDSMVGESGLRLSGGQKQRIGIARALFHQPTVLVMDEATSSLDNETEREISEAIEGMAKDKTIWIVAHRLTTVMKCDRIVFLQEGRVLADGRYEELLEDCAPFRALVHAWSSDEPASHSET